MGKIIATTGRQLMSGRQNKVMSDYEGTAMLSPISNLVPDPDFGDYNQATAELRYWNLDFPPTPDGWMPFVMDETIHKIYSRQSTGPVRGLIFDIKDELVPGGTPLDPSETIDIAPPMPPVVQAYRVSNKIGFPAGWYCIAYEWLLGGGGKGNKKKKNAKTSKRGTGPGPRSDAFEVAQGQGLLVIAPTDIPEDVVGIAYYLTVPSPNETAALFAPMFMQESFNTDNHPKAFRLMGPFNKKKKGGGNDSFIGGKGKGGKHGKGKVRRKTERLGGKSHDNDNKKKKKKNR